MQEDATPAKCRPMGSCCKAAPCSFVPASKNGGPCRARRFGLLSGENRLLSDDRAGGASALASAAVDASAGVNDGHAVLDLHSANRASALAGAAADATLGNLVCHSRTLLSTRAQQLVAGDPPPEVRSCTAAASLSCTVRRSPASASVPIVAETNRKGKTNRAPAATKTAFLAECTKASANFRGV